MEQEPFLFSRTIRENITYGVGRDVPQSEIEAAARAAAIHDVILTFPDGYNTLVGEKGVTLSGGQKQRVAIARTLLKNPRILILDDSTSSVDTETEPEIREALERLMENRTTFIIAHRIQSVMNADLILVLDHGRIVQRGTHDELLQQAGIYRQIYDIQTQIEAELEKEVGSVAEPAVESIGHDIDARSCTDHASCLSRGVKDDHGRRDRIRRRRIYHQVQRPDRSCASWRRPGRTGSGSSASWSRSRWSPASDSYFTYLRKQIIDQGITPGDTAALARIGVIYAVLIVVQAAGVFAFIYLAGMLGERVQYDLRQKMFNHLQDLSLSYYSRTPVGWIMSRVTSDSERIAELVTWGMLDVTWGVVNIVTAFTFMLAINWQLALLVLLIIPVLLFVAA